MNHTGESSGPNYPNGLAWKDENVTQMVRLSVCRAYCELWRPPSAKKKMLTIQDYRFDCHKQFDSLAQTETLPQALLSTLRLGSVFCRRH